MDEETLQNLSDIQARYVDMLMGKANVIGIGIGLAKVDGAYTNEPALVVMVEKKVPIAELAPDDVIPSTIEGVRVDVQETGPIQAF